MRIFKCSIVVVTFLILGCQLLLLLPDGNWVKFLNLATICLTLVLAGLLYFSSGCRQWERPEQGRVYGGEESCILLPHTTISQSRIILDRIRQTIESMTFSLASGAEISITISLGQVLYNPTIKEAHQLINIADTALYRAKQSGRNRLCTSDTPDLLFGCQ